MFLVKSGILILFLVINFYLYCEGIDLIGINYIISYPNGHYKYHTYMSN
jgi:hypothetical protein